MIKKMLFTLILLIFAFDGCSIGQVSEAQRTKNIYAFARIYGYIKYFYPSDEAANTDWDVFSIYGLKT